MCVCVIVCVCYSVCVFNLKSCHERKKELQKTEHTHNTKKTILSSFAIFCLSVCASVSFLSNGYSHPLIRVRHFVRKIIKVILFSDNFKGFSVLYWGKSFTSEGLDEA